MNKNDFTIILLQWYEEFGRTLSWRETKDPYAIWLSEVILQQTRIAQGQAYWERFMQRFPTVDDLASANEDEVLRLWQGLGYYSRARHLHQAALQIAKLGKFPDTLDEIKKLKGVGDYTAAAIGSISFGLPAAAVDGNFFRVLARYFGIDTPINTTEGKKLFAALAQELLPVESPAAFNQAMMDFGATQCTPSSPHCVICPLMEGCVALRKGRIGQLPVKLGKTQVQIRRLTYLYVRFEGKTAIHRRGKGDIWQGLWEPVMVEDKGEKENTVSSLFKEFSSDISQNGSIVLLRQQVKHVLTHRIIYADFYLWQANEKPVLPEDYIWIPESAIDDYAIPRLVEILLESLPVQRLKKNHRANNP